jgi:hypothetical protein
MNAKVKQLRKMCQVRLHVIWQITDTEWGQGDRAFPKRVEFENSENSHFQGLNHLEVK